MCCRPALCASGISASSAHGTGPNSFHSAFGYSKQYPQSPSKKERPTSNTTPTRLGCVLDATGRCSFLNASPLYNFASGLHPIYSRRPHDTHYKASRIRNLHRREQDPCLFLLPVTRSYLTAPCTSIHRSHEICTLSPSPRCTRASCAF
jgi:hypothetical protein